MSSATDTSTVIFPVTHLSTTLRGLIFANFANFGQIRKIKSSQKVRPFGIREKKSTHFFLENAIFFNLSLIKKHYKRYYPEACYFAQACNFIKKRDSVTGVFL